VARGSLRHLSSETLADQAYTALREAIISGELAPRETITERGLAERLAVSATPVREALRRLEQDQLVERHGPRAVQVADLDDDTATEIRLIEGTLRALAARLASSNVTARQLQRMEDLLDQGDVEVERLRAVQGDGHAVRADDLASLLQLTREFHQAVNEASNNVVLLRLLSLVDAFSLAQRVRKVQGELEGSEADRDEVARRYGEHRALFEAIRAGAGARAEQLMLAHAASTGVREAAH
jgi:DNA-binding GntR family transcriptional regulator